MLDKMKSEIRIVPISTADEIHNCTMIMVDSDPWKTLNLGYDDLIKMFKDSLNEIFVAKQGEAILGFIVLYMHGTFRGYVKCLAISKEARGIGVGSELVKFAEDKIFKEVPNVFICVSSFNKKAQEFYYRLGYKLVGELDNFIVDGYSELLLRKTVGPLKEYKPVN